MAYPDLDAEPTVLHTAEDVTADVIEHAAGCAEAAYGLGNDFRVDWERAYDMLESLYGYSLETFGSPADNKIRREVNKRRRNEGLGTRSMED